LGAFKFIIIAATLGLIIADWIRGVIIPAFQNERKYGDKDKASIRWKRPLTATIGGILFLILLVPAIGQVPAGHRGVVLRFGGVTNRTFDPGLYVRMPIAESVELMSVLVYATEIPASSSSKDLQDVTTKVTVNWHQNPGYVNVIYDQMRRDCLTRIIMPSTQEAVKASTAEFIAEDLIKKRPVVRDRIKEILFTRMATYNLVLDELSITDFTFSPEFTQAIEGKVTAVQTALQAENEAQKKYWTAYGDSVQNVMAAKAEAEAITRKAEAQAEANRKVAASISPLLVEYKALDEWNGTLPQFTGGAVPFINLNK
jgi:regulator of protease activity HflC (stomatin/prohibitin superfamily)